MPKSNVYIRIDDQRLTEIDRMADRLGIHRAQLLAMWVNERLNTERAIHSIERERVAP